MTVFHRLRGWCRDEFPKQINRSCTTIVSFPTINLDQTGQSDLSSNPLGKVTWRVNRHIDCDPDQKREWVEQDGQGDHDHDSKHLHLQNREAGQRNQPDHEGNAKENHEDDADGIGTEKVPILIGEERATRWTSLVQCGDTDKNASISTVRTMSAKRPAECLKEAR